MKLSLFLLAVVLFCAFVQSTQGKCRLQSTRYGEIGRVKMCRCCSWSIYGQLIEKIINNIYSRFDIHVYLTWKHELNYIFISWSVHWRQYYEQVKSNSPPFMWLDYSGTSDILSLICPTRDEDIWGLYGLEVRETKEINLLGETNTSTSTNGSLL